MFFKKKNRVIVLNLDKTYDDRKRGCSKGIVKIGKENKKFSPQSVFSPKKQGLIFKKPNLILIGEKCKNAYEFSVNMEGLETHWTEKEAEDTLNKLNALSIAKLKPIEWSGLIILVILILANIAISIFLATKIGAMF